MRRGIRRSLRERACLLLADMEAALLELGSAPEDMAAVGRVIRTAGCLSRSGGKLGTRGIAPLAGEMESLFHLVLGGKVTLNWRLTGLALVAADRIRGMLAVPDGAGGRGESGQILLEGLRVLRRTTEQ